MWKKSKCIRVFFSSQKKKCKKIVYQEFNIKIPNKCRLNKLTVNLGKLLNGKEENCRLSIQDSREMIFWFNL